MATTLPAGDRRETLLDTATEIVAAGDLDALSMETVAQRAGVSRPLVYKHFANKGELLAAVYRREAAAFDAEIVAAVEEAKSLEDMLRAMLRAIFRGAGSRGDTFTVLQRASGRDATVRAEQRARDRRSVRFFARVAATEFGMGIREARAAMSVLLSGIDAVVAQWRAHKGPAQERYLEDMYVGLVLGALSNVTEGPRAPAR